MKEMANNLRPRTAMTWLVLRETVKAFVANNNLETAATLAYYGFLALMPLLLLVIYSLGVVLQSSASIQNGMRELTDNLFPAFSQSMLDDLLMLARGKTWGAFSLVLLVWSLTPLAGGMRSAYRRIFKPERSLNFLLGKLRDLGAVMTLLLLLVFLVTGNALYSMKNVTLLPAHPLVTAAIKSGALFLLTIAALMLFEQVFATVRLRFSLLLLGAVAAALPLAVMRPLFELLLRFNPNYGYAFGSLKAIFLLIVWVYYTFAALLFGAEVMAAAWRRETLVLRGLFGGAGARDSVAAGLLDRFAQELPAGHVIFHEGDPDGAMFYMLSGAVALTKNDQPLRTMRAGEYFGEMSMLLGTPRTATATVAGAATRVVLINRNNFDTILRENPGVVKAILKEMAQRLKATSEQLRGG